MARGSIARYDGPRGTSYRVTLDAGTRPDGTRRQIRRAFPNKKAAERFLADTLAAINARRYGEPSREPLGSYLDRWLADLAASGVKPATEYRYRTIRRLRFPDLIHTRLCDLTTAAIDAQYAKLVESLAPATIRQAHSMLRAALADAVRRGELPRNPAGDAKLPKGKRFRPTTWTAVQARRFLAAAGDDLFGVFWRVALETMARAGELTPLRWDAVDLDAGRLVVRETKTADAIGRAIMGTPKSESGHRTIELSGGLVDVLRRHRERQEERRRHDPTWNVAGYLFPNRIGGSVNAAQVGRRLHRACAALGLPRVRVHDLRHTGATLALAIGIPIKTVSQRLGHASVTFTLNMYVHPDEDERRAAAERIAQIFEPLAEAPSQSVTRSARVLPKNRTVKPKKRV